MPELPEVEIVKQSLKNKLDHKRIKKVIVSNRNLRFRIEKEFENFLEGKSITNITRISKYIILTLDQKYFCLIHLGMSGTLHLFKYKKKEKNTNLSFYNSKILPKKHNHIKIKFHNCMIIYNDPRRFGFFKVFKNKEQLNELLFKLGPEATSKKFNFKYLKNKHMNKKKNIKNCLLDQNFVSGIGNIYANEILFLSRIMPTRKVSSLKIKELKKILIFTKKVLKKAIFLGGSSIKDFSNVSGKKGKFQQVFKVYGKIGHNCSNSDCTGLIKKIVIANRASFLCSKCQK